MSNKTVYSGHSIVFRDICGGGTDVSVETKTAWAGSVLSHVKKAVF